MSKKWRPGIGSKELEETVKLIAMTCEVNSRYYSLEYYQTPHEILIRYKGGLKQIGELCKKILGGSNV